MHSEDHSYSGVQLAAWNVSGEKLDQKYFPATYLKLLTTTVLLLGQL